MKNFILSLGALFLFFAMQAGEPVGKLVFSVSDINVEVANLASGNQVKDIQISVDATKGTVLEYVVGSSDEEILGAEDLLEEGVPYYIGIVLKAPEGFYYPNGDEGVYTGNLTSNLSVVDTPDVGNEYEGGTLGWSADLALENYVYLETTLLFVPLSNNAMENNPEMLSAEIAEIGEDFVKLSVSAQDVAENPIDKYAVIFVGIDREMEGFEADNGMITIGSLTPDTDYFIGVFAKDDEGNYSYNSFEVKFTTVSAIDSISVNFENPLVGQLVKNISLSMGENQGEVIAYFIGTGESEDDMRILDMDDELEANENYELFAVAKAPENRYYSYGDEGVYVGKIDKNLVLSETPDVGSEFDDEEGITWSEDAPLNENIYIQIHLSFSINSVGTPVLPADSELLNGKFVSKGRVVIVRDGDKFGVSGSSQK